MRRAALLLVAAPLLLAACGSKQQSAPQPVTGEDANGRIIYSVAQNEDPLFEHCPGLWTTDPDGGDLELIGPDDTFFPAVSPDGRRLAAMIEEDLWLIDLTNGHIKRLLPRLIPSIPFPPYYTWDATGEALLLSETVGDHDEIVRVDVSTRKPTNVVRAGKNELAYPTASPDGTRIAYTQVIKERLTVWIMNADGSDRRQLLTNAHSAVWSPDGKRLAVFRSDFFDEEGPLVSVDLQGKDERKLTTALAGGPSSVSWSPDGGSLLFVRRAKNPSETAEQDIYRLDLSTGAERLVASTANLAGWAPAGDRILYAKPLPLTGPAGRMGIYTSTPDGDDERIVGVQDDGDTSGVPVWQADAGKLVPPKALSGYPGLKRCVSALDRLRQRAGG
jgi:Tol biopolymer transport system component